MCAEIVNKVLYKSGIKGIITSRRIIHGFRKKIHLLNVERLRVKKKSGGYGVERLEKKWKTGKPYTVKIFYHELDNFENENKELIGQKRKLEETLEQEKNKSLRKS